MDEISTHELEELVNNLTVPASWSSTCVVKYKLLKDVIEVIEQTGKVKSTLTQVIGILKPHINQSSIPQYHNLRRTVRSKNLDLSSPVPWLSDDTTQMSIGPLCDTRGITPDVLEGAAPFHGTDCVTNGVVLEMKSFWYKNRSTWKTFCTWLSRLGLPEDLREDSVRQSVGTLYQNSLSLRRKRQQHQLEAFLSKPFEPPQTVVTREVRDKQTDMCTRLRQEVKELRQVNKEMEKQIVTQTEAREAIESALLQTTTQKTALEEEVATLRGQIQAEHQRAEEALAANRKLTYQTEKAKQELASCKDLLRKWSARNAKRREERHLQRLQFQRRECDRIQNETIRKDRLISHLQNSCASLRIQKRTLYRQRNYYKRQYETARKDGSSNKLQLAQVQLKLHKKNDQIAGLVDENTQLMKEKVEVDVQTAEGQYTNDMRQTVMNLCSRGVGSNHVGPVIQTVAQDLFGVALPVVPSATTAKRIILESNIVGKIQAAKTMLEEPNTTLHCDGTTDHQRHFFGWQVSTGKDSLCLAIGETVGGDTKTQLSELERIANELALVLATEPEARSSLEEDIMLSFKNLMTDQCVVNKLFKDELETTRRMILEKTGSRWAHLSETDRQKAASLNQWFCLLHVLLGLAEATEQALLDYQQIVTDEGKVLLGREREKTGSWRDGSAAMETIKAVCALLTPSGHPSAGTPADFSAWMGAKGKDIYLVKFCRTRFNVVFLNASAVWFHKDDIKRFIMETAQTNQLIEAVRGDMSDDIVLSCIRGVAMFHILVTAPYHRLILNREVATHILDVNPFLQEMRLTLEKLSANPTEIVADKSYNMWPQLPPKRDELYVAVMPENADEPGLQVAIEVLSLIATHCLVLFTRQVAHHLPGGEHGAGSDGDLRKSSSSVPKSNSIGESQFALLKYLRSVKPNASVQNLEATIMWAYNKPGKWLAGLSEEERDRVLECAREKTATFRQIWSDRTESLKNMRLESFNKKEAQKQQKLMKAGQMRKKNAVDINEKGGLCKSPEEVDMFIQQCESPKERMEWLKSQLRYYKNVINLPSIPKTLFNFSRLGKQFTETQLSTNLKSVLAKADSQTPSEPVELGIPPVEDRLDKLSDVRKAVLCNYSTLPSSSGPCQKGKKRMADFPDNPVGMSFRHKWRMVKRHKWFRGLVLEECPDAEPTLSEDENSNVAMTRLYRTFKVSYEGEDDPMILHLEKDYCRGDVEFLNCDQW